MSSLRSSRAYSNLQVESIRWQRSALPPGSTGSFLILDEDGVVTFGTDAILNSLTLRSLTVTQGITTGSLAVLGSMTAQNIAATNSMSAANGTVGNLRVTGNLIVDGSTLVPTGTSVVEALYIFAGATNVPVSGFQGYNLDVSGSAIFRGGLTMGGPLAATNSVIIRGATAQVLFENASGVTVGSIQGLTTGLYIESNHAVKFSNLDESAGDLLTIDPVTRLVTVGSGVTLNVRGIGGSGVTVSAPTVFTGPVTANGSVTANGPVTANGLVTVPYGNTLQVLGVIDAQGGIKHSAFGGILNLNDSVAVVGPLFVQGVIQQGDPLGSGTLPLVIQPTSGPVSIGNAGTSVTVVGPLVANQSVVVGGGLTATGRIVGSGGLTTTTGYFSGGVTVANGFSGTTANFSGAVTVGTGLSVNTIGPVSGRSIYYPVGGGSIVFENSDSDLSISAVTQLGGRVASYSSAFTDGVGVNTYYYGAGFTMMRPNLAGMFFGPSDATTTSIRLVRNDTRVDTTFMTFDTYNNRLGVLNGSPAETLDIIGTMKVSSNATVGGGLTVTGLAVAAGGLTTTTGYFSSGATAAGLLTAAGGVTATTGYFSSGATVAGLLTAAGGVTATNGYFSSGVTMSGNIYVANTANVGTLNTPIITNGTPGLIQVNSLLQVSYGIKSDSYVIPVIPAGVGIPILRSGYFVVAVFYSDGPYYGVCQGIYISLNTGSVPVTIISQSATGGSSLTFDTDSLTPNQLFIEGVSGDILYTITYLSTF